MDPNVGLQAASGLVSFLLKTTVEWCVCVVVARLTNSARWRFNLWLTMLIAFTAQWLWLWGELAWAGPAVRTVLPAGVHGLAPSKAIAVTPQLAGVLTQVLLGLFAIYAVLLVWRTAGVIVARVRLAQAMRFRKSPGERLARVFAEVLGEAQANGRDFTECELWVLPSISSPATIGVLRPCVVFAASCEAQDEPELRAALWHELKHIERRDALWNSVVSVCSSLLWFHPAVRHAANALKQERELACDAAVVREHPQSRDVYASCLLRFARISNSALPAIEMASTASLLTMRVRSILDEAPGLSPFALAGRGMANLILVGAMAAALPALNILFATQMRIPVAQIPVTNASASNVLVGFRKPVSRATNPRVLAITSPAPMPNTVGVPIQHDEELAAEHRAAMGVLTESSGMDAPAVPEERVSADTKPGPPARASLPASWGSVALNAAERIVLMSGDHDSDDRH